ncbi:MAG: flagellar biosynthesis protein FlhA [Deltaproteobacteria bacterium]|jgi:flagellar biosynthesis protein FlhA|nr:flagellar biosynthesis protein FlhA [Deltaproteobacteria bacterium]
MTQQIKEATSMSALTRNSDVVMAIGVIGMLVVMVIPIPTFMLDIFLSFNITFSVVVLLVAMYTLKALEFSVFPSLLLLATLLRLSLNVASTRLILLHGNEGVGAAGQVIRSFGSFVVGGNYVVGMVVFLILVIINFVVITKGATRIAEVAARFTLDAMPGKQMSIDADLNAGLITDIEAKTRRAEISQEADFYGAMDGASKFVRGDAIAGIVITLVNILGGLVIGVLQQGMSVSTAAQNYTLLTIGDGLVSQIPALIVSTAAGLVVTRAASDSHLGNDMISQLTGQPRAVAIASGVLILFGFIPGLPTFPFIMLGCLAGGLAYMTFEGKKALMVKEEEEEEAVEKEKGLEKVEELLPLDLLELEVGYGLIPLVDTEQGGELLERVKSIRRQFALEMGMIIPPMHIRDNLQLKPNQYSIIIKGVEVAGGELMPGYYLAMNPGDVKAEIEGIPTKEPAFGIPALWVGEKDKEKAQIAGYTVVDLSTMIATHISEILKTHAYELLGRQEVQSLLDNLALNHPKVVEELVPNLLSLGGVQKTLQNLLKEQVSIRDLLSIVETLADYAPITKNVDILTEYVRQRLARSITKQYKTPEGDIPLMTLDAEIEELVNNAIQHTEHESYLSLEPALAQKILAQFNKAMGKFTSMNYQPIILCSPGIRPHLKKLTERFIPTLVVLSHNEIDKRVKLKSLGVASLNHAG